MELMDLLPSVAAVVVEWDRGRELLGSARAWDLDLELRSGEMDGGIRPWGSCRRRLLLSRAEGVTLIAVAMEEGGVLLMGWPALEKMDSCTSRRSSSPAAMAAGLGEGDGAPKLVLRWCTANRVSLPVSSGVSAN
ncbi:hypothetical protein ACLOJK_021914 [Asimina triloba]